MVGVNFVLTIFLSYLQEAGVSGVEKDCGNLFCKFMERVMGVF